jgi:hypothetical protein
MIGVTAAGMIAWCAASASAADVPGFEGRKLVVEDETVRKECGACHMVFPPSKLTKGGWKKIMADLGNHFGEDASLSAEAAKHIEDYLVANALDAEDGIRTELRLKAWAKKGLIDPIRITETPEWIRHHPAKDTYRNMAKEVGYERGSNCIKCHKGAEYGFYEEDFGK